MRGPSSSRFGGWRRNLLEFFLDPIGVMTALRGDYGTIVPLTENCSRWLFAFGAENNRKILTNAQLFRTDTLPVAVPIDSPVGRLKRSFAFSDGHEHKRQRGHVTPAFHREHMPRYHEIIQRHTTRFLQSCGRVRWLDVSRAMHDLTFGIALEAFLGIDSNSTPALGGDLREWLRILSHPGVVLFPFNLPLTPLRTLQTLTGRIEAGLRALIAERSGRAVHTRDLLSLLVLASQSVGASISELEIAPNTLVVMLAGHESAGNSLAWTLFLLDQHRDVLERVEREVDHVLGSAPIAMAHFGQLSLLGRVIKESMRILPPLAYNLRTSTSEFTLGNSSFASGTKIVWSPYITHREPTVYAEPDRFLPDRWLDLTVPSDTYIPFGLGAHACIGGSFAQLQMTIVLAELLRAYQFSLASDTRVDRSVQITLRPKRGMPMHVDERGTARRPRWSVYGDLREMVRFP
ncbi:MAG TPA: cytochrome P450 [Polyangiaceae bacterium]|nr:cytochrome P450 [Polyangiaceae bacterium]